MIDNVTINGLTIGKGTRYSIVRGAGFGLPEQRLADRIIPARHRALIPQAFWGGRKMILEILVRGSTVGQLQTLRDNLLYAFDLPRRGEAALVIDTLAGTTVQAIVKVPYPPMLDFMPGMVSSCIASITLVAPDATFYSDDLHTQDVETSELVENSGDVPVYPTLRIYGPITNPTMQNLRTGLTLSYTGTIADGNYVEIDSFNEIVSDQAGVNRIAKISGIFWTLLRGDNSIQLGGSATGANTKLRVIWRDGFHGFTAATLLDPGAIDKWDWTLSHWDEQTENWDADI